MTLLTFGYIKEFFRTVEDFISCFDRKKKKNISGHEFLKN